MTTKFYRLLVFVALLGTSSCIEPFDFETETFESAIVVEGRITNEVKNHEINITRTFMFEEDGPSAESAATVHILVDGQNPIPFEETEPGVYQAVTAFAAEPNRDYELKITSSNGRSYSSRPVQLTQATSIESLSVERRTNGIGEDGVAILVDSFDPSGNSVYYRYEYEETYKVIAPQWTGDELYIINQDSCQVGVRIRSRQERTCYGTQVSNTIILTTTGGLTEDRVVRFPVRFVKSNDYIMSHRYSALVRQYVVSRESHSFYETLLEISGSESLFSQNQPGFLTGNISSDTNVDERVIGFFDVSTVAEERVFFNYVDLYPNTNLPPYVIACNLFSPQLKNTAGISPLIQQINMNSLSFVDFNIIPPPKGEGPYLVVKRACGDCNELGTNQIPDFWIE